MIEEERKEFFLDNADAYRQWKNGTFIPNLEKLNTMKKDGFDFPENFKPVFSGSESELTSLVLEKYYRK